MEKVTPAMRLRQLPWKWGLYITAGLLLFGWFFNTPTGLLGKADAVGYAVCHRIDLRSFHLGEQPTPLCARCTGMYLGAMLTLGYQIVLGGKRYGMPPLKIWLIFGGLVAAFGIDGLNSYFHLPMMAQLFPSIPSLYEPSNTLRLLTGTGMGIVIMAALFPVFNQTIWADLDSRPFLGSWRSMGLLLLLAVLLDLIVLTENPVALYPLAILSTLGVFVILTMVYSMVWVMLLRRENRITNLGQLALPLLAGFVVSLAQIAALDFIRYQLTHTWAGFPIG